MLRVVQVVRQQQCNGHCLCDSAQTQQLKQQLRSAQVDRQWRRDTALTLPLFRRRSTVSPVSFGRYPRSSLHSVVPFPPSLISLLASVDVKQHRRRSGQEQAGPVCIKDGRATADRIVVQELCESRGGRPGLSVLTSLLVSVDVKLY